MNITDLINEYTALGNDQPTTTATTTTPEPVAVDQISSAPEPVQWFYRDGRLFTGEVDPTCKRQVQQVTGKVTCPYCHGFGTGYYARSCMSCLGYGQVTRKGVTVYTKAQLNLLNAQEERKQRAKEERAQRQREETDRALQEEIPEWGTWAAKFQPGTFGHDVMATIRKKGKFSDRQVAALRKAYDRECKGDGLRAQWAKENAASQHVGTVGDRSQFTLTIKAVTPSKFYEGWWYLMVDGDGNQFIYSGSADLGEKGDTTTFTATIKEHRVEKNDQTKRTKLSRPRVNK